MTTKSVFYIITAVVLIYLFQSSERVLIEFVKASNQPEGGSFKALLMPDGSLQPMPSGQRFDSTPHDVATR